MGRKTSFYEGEPLGRGQGNPRKRSRRPGLGTAVVVCDTFLTSLTLCRTFAPYLVYTSCPDRRSVGFTSQSDWAKSDQGCGIHTPGRRGCRSGDPPDGSRPTHTLRMVRPWYGLRDRQGSRTSRTEEPVADGTKDLSRERAGESLRSGSRVRRSPGLHSGDTDPVGVFSLWPFRRDGEAGHGVNLSGGGRMGGPGCFRVEHGARGSDHCRGVYCGVGTVPE